MVLFFVDVTIHVHADAVVSAHHGVKSVEVGKARISMSKNALMEVREGKKVHPVRGEFLVEMQDSEAIQSPFGVVTCVDGCRGIFERRDDALVVKGLKGQWQIRRLGDGAAYELPAGYQVRLGLVTSLGVADMEMPQALPWLTTLEQWSKLHTGPKADFLAQVREFRPVWRRGVDGTTELHAALAQRSLASHYESLERERKIEQQRQREDAELRRQFREKNFVFAP